MKNIFNFNSGPGMLPIEVLHKVKKELCNWNNLGISIMEISHRSKEFLEIVHSSEEDLRELLEIPENYKVLFCQGGAQAQFSAVPMNLLYNCSTANYINSGYWSYSAIKEAKKYCNPHIIDVTYSINGLRAIKLMSNWSLSDKGAYIHYCPNETIDGLAINELPNFDNFVVVADFSSKILSSPLNINRFGVIYACAQKNIGPAGLTLVIIREDLLDRSINILPSVLNYNMLANKQSIFNTPPIFAWYVSALVFKWLKEKGGLIKISKLNQIKAELLYRVIDASDFYHNNIESTNRSIMNVPFYLLDNRLDKLFLQQAQAIGLYGLKGHRAVGGMRAALYNAMPLAGVQSLVNFMLDFAQRYG